MAKAAQTDHRPVAGKGGKVKGAPARAQTGKASAPKVLPQNTKAPTAHGGSTSDKTPPNPNVRSETKGSPFNKFHGKSVDQVHRAAKGDETNAGPQHPGYRT